MKPCTEICIFFNQAYSKFCTDWLFSSVFMYLVYSSQESLSPPIRLQCFGLLYAGGTFPLYACLFMGFDSKSIESCGSV